MDTQQKKTITELINICKNLKFENDYDKFLFKLLKDYILGIDVNKFVSVDFTNSLTQDKCENNKLTTFRTKLKTVIVCNEANKLLTEFINKYQNISDISDNYNIKISQLLYIFNNIINLENEIKKYVIQSISNNLYKIMPKNINTNNLTNMTASYLIENENFENFDNNILNEIFHLFTSNEYNVDNVLNFGNDIQYDIKFIKFIDMIYEKGNKCKGIPNVIEYNNFSRYYQDTINKSYKIHADIFRNSLNLSINKENIMWGYNSIKENKEGYNALKEFLDAYYGDVKIKDLPNNKNLLVICLIGFVQNIKNDLSHELFLNLCKNFYDKLKSYWPSINKHSGIYFKYEPKFITEEIDLFNNYQNDLFNFESWGINYENYNDIYKILYDLYNDIKKKETKIVKKHKYNINKKTIPKALKNASWNKYIGKDKGTSKCLCCKNNEIDSKHFECGHIISEANGGDISLENLRPICSVCNKSMGTTNMDDFIKQCGF